MRRGRDKNPLGKIQTTARAACLCCASKTPFTFVGLALSQVPTGVSPENVQAWWFALYSGAAQYLEKQHKAHASYLLGGTEELNASSFAEAVKCVSCSYAANNALYAAVLPDREGYSTGFHCTGCFARRFRADVLKPLLAVRVDRTSPDLVLTLWAYRNAYLKQAAETPAVALLGSVEGALTF